VVRKFLSISGRTYRASPHIASPQIFSVLIPAPATVLACTLSFPWYVRLPVLAIFSSFHALVTFLVMSSLLPCPLVSPYHVSVAVRAMSFFLALSCPSSWHCHVLLPGIAMSFFLALPCPCTCPCNVPVPVLAIFASLSLQRPHPCFCYVLDLCLSGVLILACP